MQGYKFFDILKNESRINSNLAVTKSLTMKLKEMLAVNRDPAFSGSWLTNQLNILLLLTIGGTGIVLFWQLLDQYYVAQFEAQLKWIRITTIVIYLLNLLVAVLRKSPRAHKQHLIAGFYLGTIFCSMMAVYTGASASPYWFGLFFIIVAWFIIMPYSFFEMIVHSLFFLLIFFTALYIQPFYELVNYEMGRIIFLYSGTLFVGFFAAYIRNNLNAENFKIRKELEAEISDRIKKEKELKKFRQVLEQAPGAVFITDKYSNFEYINPFFTEISGYTKDDLLHKNIFETLYKGANDVPDSRKHVVENLSQGKSWQGELLTVHKNGQKYWANTIAAPVKDEQGIVDGYIVIQQDITENKRMQQALESSEKRYRELTEMLPQTVYELDLKGNFKYMNQTGMQKFGVTRSYVGESAFNLIAPEDHERMLANMKKSLSDGAQTRGNEYTAITADGKKFPVMIFASALMENGKVSGTRGIVLDMTEHRDMENALLKSEKKYRELADLLPQTVYEHDLEGKITYLNKAGRKAFEIDNPDAGVSAFSLVVPEDLERMKENMRNNFASRSWTKGNNYTAVKASGEKFPVMIFAAPTFSDGKITGTRGIVVDVTEQVEMEKALKRSEEKYRTLIEKAVDGIIITQHGKLKFVNRAFCNLIQYSEKELLENPYKNFVVQEDHQMMEEYHRRRMSGEDFQTMYRSRIYKKDGSLMEVELNARTSQYNNEPAAFIIVRDITDRLKAEEELRIAKSKLEALNQNLETRIKESSQKLTEANTQLIRLQKENLQSQFEVLRQQVNPHFLFNSLNVLTSLIKLEPDLAEKFTEHLSKVYRYVLENKDNNLVNLKTELDFLDAYIFLLNIRFMNKIEVNVSIEDDKKELKILPLALQLLIENAIKHNSMSKKNPLKIDIFVENENTLTVENNLQERESHMASTGVGLKNINHRYSLLEMPAPQFYKTETKFIARIPLSN